jgi:hypothetical protein
VPDRPVQLALPRLDARTAPREVRVAAARLLADALAGILLEPVRLTVHDNRSTMISFRRRPGSVHYRVHHLFLDAPEEVVRALAAFVGSPRARGARRDAGRRIDDWIRTNRSRIAEPRPARLEPLGRHHDLQAIFDGLNAEHFGGEVEARIGWGAWRGRGRRRTIKTGVYLHDARVIRIHPALDRPDVPAFYVRAVVFHEMLHQVVPVEEAAGRRVVHGPEFRRRERAHLDHARARAWEEGNLHVLLGRPRGPGRGGLDERLARDLSG